MDRGAIPYAGMTRLVNSCRVRVARVTLASHADMDIAQDCLSFPVFDLLEL
jgi:hypothetical protein